MSYWNIFQVWISSVNVAIPDSFLEKAYQPSGVLNSDFLSDAVISTDAVVQIVTKESERVKVEKL